MLPCKRWYFLQETQRLEMCTLTQSLILHRDSSHHWCYEHCGASIKLSDLSMDAEHWWGGNTVLIRCGKEMISPSLQHSSLSRPLSCDNRDNTPWRSQKLPITDDSSAKVNAQNAPVFSKTYCTGQTEVFGRLGYRPWIIRIRINACTYMHVWKQVLQNTEILHKLG